MGSCQPGCLWQHYLQVKNSFSFFKILFIYLRERERAQAAVGAEGEGEADCLLSPMWGSIPGPQDHDLSQRQMLNRLSHLGAPSQSR